MSEDEEVNGLTLAGVGALVVVGSNDDASLTDTELIDFQADTHWDQRPDYKISNIYWTIDTISADQTYGDMLRGKIAQFGFISILFKRSSYFVDL